MRNLKAAAILAVAGATIIFFLKRQSNPEWPRSLAMRSKRVADEARSVPRNPIESPVITKLPAGARTRAELVPGMRPIDDLKNLGNGSPQNTVESIFWTMARVDVAGLGKLIAFGPRAQSKAEAAFAAQSDEIRQKFSFSSPEEMTAFQLGAVLPEAVGLQLGADLNPTENGEMETEDGEVQQVQPGDVVVTAAVQGLDGSVDKWSFILRNNGSGWLWVLPEPVMDAAILEWQNRTGNIAP